MWIGLSSRWQICSTVVGKVFRPYDGTRSAQFWTTEELEVRLTQYETRESTGRKHTLMNTMHLPARPQTVTLDGAAVTDFQWDETASTATVDVPACGKEPRTLVCE